MVRVKLRLAALIHTTFFRGKVVHIVPKEYDAEFKARAGRLVADHAEEYDTRAACRPLLGGATRVGNLDERQ